MMIGEGHMKGTSQEGARAYPLQVCTLHTVLHSLGVGLVDVLGVFGLVALMISSSDSMDSV